MRLFTESLETIDFQNNDRFLKDSDKVFSSILSKLEVFNTGNFNDEAEKTCRFNEQIEPELNTLKALVKSRFNMNIKIICDEQTEAAIYVFSAGQSVFFKRTLSSIYNKRGLTELSKGKRYIDVEVDLAKAVIKGDASKYEHEVYYNLKVLGKLNLTAQELTAILLHELGHAFTTFEYFYLLESGNIALLNIIEGQKSKDTKKIKYGIDILCRGPDCKVTEEELLNGTMAVGLIAYLKYFNEIRSQMPNMRYDETSSENAADMFVSRFGYYKHIVSGLDKVYGTYGHYNIGKYEDLSWLFYLIIIALLIGFSGVLSFILFYILISAIMFGLGDSINYKAYDDPKVRFIRIKQQAIENLKNKNISNELAKEIINEIDKIDAILSKVPTHKPITIAVVNSINKLIFSGIRDREFYYTVQRNLEELAYNELFVSSATLKTI
jgi:hypothetical protein